jgi:hypothetical protein
MNRGLAALATALLLSLGLASAASAADPAEVDLAERYAPVVRLVEQTEPCGAGEPYEPVDVELVLGNDEVAFRGPWDRVNLVSIAPTGEQIGAGKYGYHLDFPGDALDPQCDFELWQNRIKGGSPPTVYAHVATDPDYPGRLALQYWFFYVYNDWNNLHEGDWEMIQLNFEAGTAADALSTGPYEVGYSQHEGAERADWGEEKLELVDGTHPVVYPAAGSHANFFEAALFLGRSAEQGVGCDDTNGPHREIRPATPSVPSNRDEYLAEYPWLGYLGRWGEQQLAFYNGPTGPNDKLQWTQPITWSETEWRDKAFAVPAGDAFGPAATTVFCEAVSIGSTLLVLIKRNPLGVAAFLSAVVLLLFWAASRTQWESSAPLRLARRRAWGQIVTSTRRMYTGRFRIWVAVGVVFIPVLLVASGLQAIVFHLTSLANLAESAGESNGAVALIAFAIGLAFAVITLTFVQALTAVVLVSIDEGRGLSVRHAYGAVLRNWKDLLGALALLVVVLVLLSLVVIGIPIAIWLLIRWAFLAQSLVLEDLPPLRALRRSSELVRGRWWKVATVTAFTTGLALLLGPLVGIGLLFATTATFDVVNIVSSIVYTITIPFAAIATTYLYFDCKVHEQLDPLEERRVDTLPAEV